MQTTTSEQAVSDFDRFLTLEEVIAILHMPRRTFLNKRHACQGWGPPATKVSRSLLFRESTFWEWADALPTENSTRTDAWS